MNYRRLNKNAATFNFQNTDISKALKEFFRVLFTKWNTENIEFIISMVSITTTSEANIFFKELLINAYQLVAEKNSELNYFNILVTIDTLDVLLPQTLIEKLNTSSDSFLLTYAEIKKNAFNEFLKRIQALFELFREMKIVTLEMLTNNIESLIKILKEINNVLNLLTELCQLKYFHLFVYNACKFLWSMMYRYNDLPEIKRVLLKTFSDISHQMANLLLWKIDEKNDLEASRFILYLFQTFKTDLINGMFSQNEIPLVLNIIDQHNRFLGRVVDAIPENVLDESGLVICASFTKAIENDEVYEDYETFLDLCLN